MTQRLALDNTIAASNSAAPTTVDSRDDSNAYATGFSRDLRTEVETTIIGAAHMQNKNGAGDRRLCREC